MAPVAAALGLGCVLARVLDWAPIPLLLALAALGLAWGRRTGFLLCAAALGLGWGIVARDGEAAPVRDGRSFEGLVRVDSPWISPPEDPDLLQARGLLRTVRVGLDTWSGAESVRLSWRGDAATGAPPPPGTQISVRANLAAPQGFANRALVASRERRVTIKSAIAVRPITPPEPIDRLAAKARAWIDRSMPVAQRDRPGIVLARAFLVSDVSGFPDAWTRGFRRAGLSHLLAVSGFNVSWLALLILWVWPTRPRWLRAVVAVAVVSGYLLAVGNLHPVARAATMTLLATVAIWSHRPPALVQGLALAALATLATDPAAVAEVSFQLTYAATAGLLMAAPALAPPHLRGLPSLLVPLLAATVVGQTMTWPWAVGLFGQLQTLGPVYNALAAPWALLVLTVSAGSVLLGAIAAPALPACWALLDALAVPIDWISRPGPIPGFLLVSPSLVTVTVACAMAAWALWRPGRWLWVGTVAFPLFVWALGWLAPPEGHEPPGIHRVVAFDVGQGEATLLSGGGVSILVDGGGWIRGDFGGRVLGPALRAEGIRRLDVAIVSHADIDHCTGVSDVADLLPMDEVWADSVAARSSCVERLAAAVSGRRRILARGDVLRRGAWTFEVLWPPAASGDARSDNDVSLVLRVTNGGLSFLFTGDVSQAVERQLVLDGGLRSSHLKVGHHGSGSSTSTAFLDAVRPRWAWISCGRPSPFGHPHPRSLARLAQARIAVLRTDRDGEISWRWSQTSPTARLERPRSVEDTLSR